MRKYMVAWLVLGGMLAAQRLKVPIFHRDPVDAQRAALHEKLTRLAETRNSLGMSEVEPGGSAELDALTASAQPKRSASKAAKRHVRHRAAATRSTWPPPSQVWTAGEQEPSLGEVARKYRAEKRRAHASSARDANASVKQGATGDAHALPSEARAGDGH